MDAVISGIPLEATTGGRGIPVGTPVYDLAGEKVGTVADADAYDLVVERGFFFVHSYPIKLSDVERYENGALHLKITKVQVLKPDSAETGKSS